MIGLARILLLALPILASSAEGRAEIFRFTEPDGTVHYSNVPVDHRYRPFALPSDTPFSQLRTMPPGERARLYRLIDAAARAVAPRACWRLHTRRSRRRGARLSNGSGADSRRRQSGVRLQPEGDFIGRRPGTDAAHARHRP